jgi:heme-degrading monooxygenase HmoA
MIIRTWSARTADGLRADAYEDVFRTHVLAELADLEGFRGAHLLRRPHGPGAELMTLTLFDSMAAVRRFAGADHERANLSALARTVLDDPDERVRHFTVASPPGPGMTC